MIDDPKQELQNLQEQLHALEQKDEEFEDFYAGILEEFGKKTPNEEDYLKDLLTDKPKNSRPVHTNTYADQQKKTPPVKKDHSIRNLTILIVIELLGIGGVVAWWLLRLL